MSVGIKETREVISFLKVYAEELIEKQEDDGMIDGAEALASLFGQKDAALKAVLGSWEVPKELQDLDDEEKETLLAESLDLVGVLAELFLNVELVEEDEA